MQKYSFNKVSTFITKMFNNINLIPLYITEDNSLAIQIYTTRYKLKFTSKEELVNKIQEKIDIRHNTKRNSELEQNNRNKLKYEGIDIKYQKYVNNYDYSLFKFIKTLFDNIQVRIMRDSNTIYFYSPSVKHRFRIVMQDNNIERFDKDHKLILNERIKYESKGIFTFFLYQHEWMIDNERRKTKNFIKIYFSKNEVKYKVADCWVQKCDTIDKSNFLDQHHLLGRIRAVAQYALLTKNNHGEPEMIGVMSLGRPHLCGYSGERVDYEITRFVCIKVDDLGAAFNKMIMYFRQNHMYLWDRIRIYNDPRMIPNTRFLTDYGWTVRCNLPEEVIYINPITHERTFVENFNHATFQLKLPGIYNNNANQSRLGMISKCTQYWKMYDAGRQVFHYFRDRNENRRLLVV